MNNKHTPGPWKKQVISGKYYYKIYTDTEHIAGVDLTENANLIAAAPELLEALNKCSALLYASADEKGDDGSYAKDCYLAMINARAVISKAKGK